MTYRQGFDRLGNQVSPPKASWQHRVIRWASVVTIVASLAVMLWGR